MTGSQSTFAPVTSGTVVDMVGPRGEPVKAMYVSGHWSLGTYTLTQTSKDQ
jgi:hypothetical protein